MEYWTIVAAIVGVLALIVTTLLGIYSIGKDIAASKKKNPKQSKFKLFFKIIIGKVFGPKLRIVAKDINCHVNFTNYSDGTSPNFRQRLQWYIDCLVEVNNHTLREASEIEGKFDLYIENRLCTDGKALRINQLSAGSKSQREQIVFKLVFFDEQAIEYPDASYELRFSYTCKQYPGNRTAKFKGNLCQMAAACLPLIVRLRN